MRTRLHRRPSPLTRPERGRLAAYSPARDGADAIRLAELQAGCTMAWFDAQPAHVRAAWRGEPDQLKPPTDFAVRHLLGAGCTFTPAGLVLPPAPTHA